MMSVLVFFHMRELKAFGALLGLGGLISTYTLPSREPYPATMLRNPFFGCLRPYAQLFLVGVRLSFTKKLFGFTARQASKIWRLVSLLHSFTIMLRLPGVAAGGLVQILYATEISHCLKSRFKRVFNASHTTWIGDSLSTAAGRSDLDTTTVSLRL